MEHLQPSLDVRPEIKGLFVSMDNLNQLVELSTVDSLIGVCRGSSQPLEINITCIISSFFTLKVKEFFVQKLANHKKNVMLQCAPHFTTIQEVVFKRFQTY